MHIFTEKLSCHVEADTHTIILFTDFSDGLNICSATQGCHSLQYTQQFLAFEKNGDTVQLPLGVAVDREQHALQLDLLGFFIEGVGATEICARNL